jgi:protein-export membrane protein SecD
MVQIARWRVILVLVVTILGLVFAAPNLIPEQARAALPGYVPKNAINLGLDLQGGSSLLLEIELPTLRRQRLDAIADGMARALREAEPRIEFGGRGVFGDAARVRLQNPADGARALAELRENVVSQIQARNLSTPTDDIELTLGADGLIEARLTAAEVERLSRDAVARSIEVVRRRIDPNGTSEVAITRQGDSRISVEAPGDSDPESLKRRIGQTALLTFHLVNDQADMAAVQAGHVPPSSMIAQPFSDGAAPELVFRRPSLTGKNLINAQSVIDSQTGQYAISIRFDGAGARTFCRISTQYTGRRFAILLDDKVLTAPVFREPICAGSGQIDGSFTAQEASELSLLLRAGALPVPLAVIQQSTVGAQLGQDAIEAGAKAGLIALVGTLLFMLLAYGTFGTMACVALIINGVLLTAAMSMIGAALTLPGIAGVILTLAMAVDANVLIYERMRDEERAGRGPALAIDAGFGRAIITIVDANLTTIGAAVILFWFGAGPVRGFAWTLSIGVITSVFTAVFVTQVLIAYWFRLTRPKRLPI